MKTPILQTEELTKTFEIAGYKFDALKKVNMEVSAGEFVAVMGPSGSGKTTLLSLIGCLDKPTHGQVILDGMKVTTVEEHALYKIRREKIGFIFQRFNLIDNLTALENVELAMEYTIKTGKERKKRACDLLELVGLGEREKHKPAQLSIGEQQRVAVARALVNKPVLILADEPTGNLDSVVGLNVVTMLKELTTKQGCTVIMVTHDVNMASHADRVILLKDGILSDGPVIDNTKGEQLFCPHCGKDIRLLS